MAEILDAIARELEHARGVGTRLEAAFCSHAVRSTLDGAVIQDMQQLDGMIQHLAALRDFVSTLAKTATGSASTATALERILLGDVRARLGGGVGYQPEGETEVWQL